MVSRNASPYPLMRGFHFRARIIRNFVMMLIMTGYIWVNPVQASPTIGIPYRIHNVLNNLCLDVDGHSNDKGANLVLGSCATADKWAFVPVLYLSGLSINIVYEMKNARSGLCANVLGGGKEDTTFVIQWTCSSTAKNTLWKFSQQTLQSPIPGLFPVTIDRFYDVNSGKPMSVYVVVDFFAVIPYVVINQNPQQSDIWMMGTD